LRSATFRWDDDLAVLLGYFLSPWLSAALAAAFAFASELSVTVSCGMAEDLDEGAGV
jgi:hypothetical protein